MDRPVPEHNTTPAPKANRKTHRNTLIYNILKKEVNKYNNKHPAAQCRGVVFYLPGPRMSLISTLRKGRKGFPQKGQVVFRLESSAVQPAMISSS